MSTFAAINSREELISKVAENLHKSDVEISLDWTNSPADYAAVVEQIVSSVESTTGIEILKHNNETLNVG